MSDESTIRIGVLAPLSEPGWVEAGQHLLAGIELAASDVNDAGGVDGRPIELMIRDTAADAGRATAAIDELAQAGVTALAGEYHSVVARAAAARADSLGLPYLCSSAVIDRLTDRPSEWIARIAPAQSHSWSIFINHLIDAGHESVAVVAQPSVYWDAGIRILTEHLSARGGTLFRLDGSDPSRVPDELAVCGATALLLLTGIPEPAASIVRAVRRDPRHTAVAIGAPAGQPELPGWRTLLGDDSGGVSFLRYLPPRLSPLGARVEAALHQRLAATPSFVSFEGYDTIAVLADLLRHHDGTGPLDWARADTEGTRGRITLSRSPQTGLWQWTWPAVQVADRDPDHPDMFRTLTMAV